MFGLLRLKWFITLLPRAIGYLADGRVPAILKVIPFLIIPFLFTPVSRATNAIPVWGLLDDFTLILLCLTLFTWLSNNYLRRKKEQGEKPDKGFTTIEGEYKIVDKKTTAVK